MEYLYTEPIKMTRGTHYGNNYWIFHSRKLGRRVTAFSNLEYANLLSLEMNPDVIHYCEQPCKQAVIVEGKKHETVFDVYVVYRNSMEEFQEVKYSDELEADNRQGERSRKQIEIQKYWCLQNNFKYCLRTDADIIPGKHTLNNLQYLCSKARRYIPDEALNDNVFIQNFSRRSNKTIGSLFISGWLSTKKGLDYLADLYYRGIITFNDIDDSPITNQTEVILNAK
jgi:hypothetical protein